MAKSFPDKEKELTTARGKVVNLQKETEISQKKLNEIENKYDRELHQTEKSQLLILKTKEAESNAKLNFARQTDANLQKEIERLTKIREEMQAEFAEKSVSKRFKRSRNLSVIRLKKLRRELREIMFFMFPMKQICCIARLPETRNAR